MALSRTNVYRVTYGRSDCLAQALGQLYGIPTSGGSYGLQRRLPRRRWLRRAWLLAAAVAVSVAAMEADTAEPTAGAEVTEGLMAVVVALWRSVRRELWKSRRLRQRQRLQRRIRRHGSLPWSHWDSEREADTGFGYPAFGGYSAQAPAGSADWRHWPAARHGDPATAAAVAAAQAGIDQPRPPRIVPNPLDNALIIQSDAQQYQSILKILKELDVPPRQILLEAKIYEVDLTDQFASGIQYNLQQRSGTYRKPTASLISGVGTFNIGTLVDSGRELLATLSLNENRDHVHMMSEPSLIATDSIPASINVGTQVPVSTGSTTIPAGGNTVTTNSVSSQDTGVTLQVNARVNPSGIVTLYLNQQVSAVDAQASQVAGSPAFDQQVVQTQITMQDGDTIAIGGTIKDTVEDQLNGIPGLVRLPWIGGLFGSKMRTHQRSELIMFMTPHVIYDETDLIEASDELKNRVKLLKKMVKDL